MPTLKEIIFDVPYIPNEQIVSQFDGKTEEECNKITVEDYNNNYKERNFKFRLQARFILSLFERLLGGFKNDQCSRIIINCVPVITKEPRHFDGYYYVQVSYDINNFFQLDDLDKKKKILELIQIGLTEIINKERWDRSLFDRVFNQIIDGNYINQWVWKKQKSSPGRQYIAKVLCDHKMYSCDIKVMITDKEGNVLKEKTVVTAKPDEWAYAKYFGDLKWLLNNEVVLISKNKECEFKIKID
jgi:hypothetical protein